MIKNFIKLQTKAFIARQLWKNNGYYYVMLQEDELKGVPVLVLANKTDLPGAMEYDDIYKGLGLDSVQNRQWSMFKTSAMDGSGLKEGFSWLTNTLKG